MKSLIGIILMFNSLFTTYEMVEPPPIVSEDTKIVQQNYKQFLQTKPLTDYRGMPSISFDSISSQSSDPLKAEPEAPIVFDEFNTPDPPQSSTNNIIDLARSFVGTKYTWGGTSPSSGFDCSGLLHYVFKQNGIDLPRSTTEIFKSGTEVPSLSDAQVGDIICTPGQGATGKHVKIISKIEDGQIWTIEAKGQKAGIIESPLTKTDNIKTIRRISSSVPSLSNTQSSIASFSSNADYAKTMYQYLYKALEDNGIDGSTWAPILTAHTSIESGWGNKFSRENNNFGGIKGKGSAVVSTKEWSPSRGYYTIKDTFKSYPSIQAFADDYVKKLKNKFKAFDGTPAEYLSNIRKHGYFTASLSDYQRMFNGRLNNINNLLNSQ